MWPLLVYALISQTEAPSPSEWKNPEDPSVKRFQEIIAAAIENEPDVLQEELISLRARLAIAERKKNEARDDTAAESLAKKPNFMRSLQAEIDHYTKLIASKELTVLQLKQKEIRQKKRRGSRKN